MESTYKQFVHAGANLNDTDKTQLKKLNEQLAALSDDFDNKLLAATKKGAYVTTDKSSLAGLNDAQIESGCRCGKRAARLTDTSFLCRTRPSSRTSAC